MNNQHTLPTLFLTPKAKTPSSSLTDDIHLPSPPQMGRKKRNPSSTSSSSSSVWSSYDLARTLQVASVPETLLLSSSGWSSSSDDDGENLDPSSSKAVTTAATVGGVSPSLPNVANLKPRWKRYPLLSSSSRRRRSVSSSSFSSSFSSASGGDDEGEMMILPPSAAPPLSPKQTRVQAMKRTFHCISPTEDQEQEGRRSPLRRRIQFSPPQEKKDQTGEDREDKK